ncbi:MAG: RagB/SusD family nutrient uptake outer membrane protein [Cyclobacteriaceae bacterium]
MKRALYYLTIYLIVTIAVSCDELDNEPIGLLTEDQVDNNPTLTTLESSVTSTYFPLRSTLWGGVPNSSWDLGTIFRNDIILQDIASHDMNKKWNPDGDQAWMDRVADFSFTPDNQAFNGIWTYDYEGISRANLAIQFLTDDEVVNATGINAARKNQLLSEVYFLRAYYYFDLLNNFGDVPLILTPPDSFEEALDLSVKSPSEEVRNQINTDLSAAKSLAVNEKFPDADDPWRISKGAIIALQAKVALYNQNWVEVLNYIQELEGFGFYALNENYFDSFNAEKEFAENEVIFTYDHQSNEVPRDGNGLGRVMGWGFFAPTENFLNAFEPNDPRFLYTTDVVNQRSSKLLGSTSDFKGNDDGPGNKIYIRYADVLLWKAEALNETGDYSGAIAIINSIRQRARTTPMVDGSMAPPETLADRPQSTDKALIKEWLISERRVELGFEAQRFNDLKRWGIAQEFLRSLGVNFESHNMLYPIPQPELDKSGGTIVQNSGY